MRSSSLKRFVSFTLSCSKTTPLIATNSSYVNIHNLINSNTRNFSSQPDWMVVTDPAVHSNQIKVPYLRESTKLEIYNRFKGIENGVQGEEWSISRLSQHYSASPDRIKAVIYLFENKEKIMRENKLNEISQDWKDIFYKSQTIIEPKQGETVEVKKLEKGDFFIGTSAHDLAEEYKLSVDEIKEIVKKMKTHTFNMENMKYYESEMEGILTRLEERGVDTKFRETAVSLKRSSVKDNYFPELFGDTGEEEAKRKLLKRIEIETRAKKIVDFDAFVAYKNHTNVTKSSKEVKIESETIETGKLSRWKFAYRDLSGGKNQETAICNRSGKLRAATALEESKRSWIKNPTQLDFNVLSSFSARNVLTELSDPDGDELEASMIADKKRVKRLEYKNKI